MSCLSHTCAQLQDVFGILTNGNKWVFFRFQHGKADVHYETHQLRVILGHKSDGLADQVEELLSAVVGIISHQVQSRREGNPMKRERGRLEGRAVKRARSRCKEEDSPMKRVRRSVCAYPGNVPTLALCSVLAITYMVIVAVTAAAGVPGACAQRLG